MLLSLNPRLARLASIALLLGSLALAALPRQANAQACTFTLGFAQVAALIPDVVASCTSGVTFNGQTGDALQSTTRGLLVWRKSDNFTAFTDGATSWVNGPLGLQTRASSERFWWEPNPERLAITPAPVSGDRCHTSGLELSLDNVDVGAGNLVGTFELTNRASVECSLYGFVGAQMLDGANNPLPTKVDWGGGWMMNQPGPSTISLSPGESGVFRIHWEQVPVGNETTCPASSFLAVTPPDEYTPLILPIVMRACGGGRLDVSAVTNS